MSRLCFFLFFLCSCGYTIQSGSGSLGGVAAVQGEVQRVFVPVVDNLSVRTGIEHELTNALREALSGLTNIEIVNSDKEARFVLHSTLQSYSTVHGLTPVTGAVTQDNTSATRGGLGVGQVIMGDLIVTLDMQIKLLERLPGQETFDHVIWSRRFSKSGTFESSKRFGVAQGTSSAPSINASREIVEVRILAKNLAQDVLDQVVQNF